MYVYSAQLYMDPRGMHLVHFMFQIGLIIQHCCKVEVVCALIFGAELITQLIFVGLIKDGCNCIYLTYCVTLKMNISLDFCYEICNSVVREYS